MMARALEVAALGLGRTHPNPAVGAVIAKGDRVLATGFHAKAGGPHAEIEALAAAGAKARGATLYSTLEPCCHRGRTGPCTEAVIAAGIARVVIGTIDPNPKVRGRGEKKLRATGIEVVRGVREEECRALNENFNFAIVHGRPFVTLKIAMSLDGKVATRAGESQWITSEAAREDGRQLRARANAIVVGVETVLADDPRLTARIEGAVDPVRLVLDSKLRTPLRSALVKTAREVQTVIATTALAKAAARRRLEAAGVEVLVLPDQAGRVDLVALLAALHARGLIGVLVEGGPTVAGAFLDAGLVDKVRVYVAPLLIGGAHARPAIGGDGAGPLAEALRFGLLETGRVGDDVVLTATRK